MKPVDLQVSVPKSQDISRAYHLRDRVSDTALFNIAAGLKREIERRQATVSQADSSANGRIEGGEQSGSGADNSPGQQMRKPPKERKPARDPKKGQIVDITAGFLA